MAKRFFVDKNNIKINGENISVFGPEVHHINVLRHKIGDSIKVNEYLIQIYNINNTEVIGKILDIEDINNESNVAIILYQSYIKSDKMEYVVQKSVELGVNKIVPFISKNSVVKLDSKDRTKKVDRLNKISIEASKQCNRHDIVPIYDILDIKDKELFISNLNQNDINILAYEKSDNSLKEVLDIIKEKSSNKLSVGIVIGPEGGFDESDIQVLKQVNNMYEVTLGTRILRAETASLNLLSILNYVLEN